MEITHKGAGKQPWTVHAIDARPKNWSIPVALVVLREESSYGYTLMERLTGLGFEEINPGTLYRALRKMENEGLCDSGWETSEVGPACRAYSITGAGEAYLDSWARASERYQPVLDAFSLAYGRRRGTLPPAGERSESS